MFFFCQQSFPHFFLYSLDEKEVVIFEYTDGEEGTSHQDKKSMKLAQKQCVSIKKRDIPAPAVGTDDEDA